MFFYNLSFKYIPQIISWLMMPTSLVSRDSYLFIDRLRSSAIATCKGMHAYYHQEKGSYWTIKESNILGRVQIKSNIPQSCCTFILKDCKYILFISFDLISLAVINYLDFYEILIHIFLL